MPEISHVRITVPEQGILNRILREGASVLYHYVIIDYLCDYVAGQPRVVGASVDAGAHEGAVAVASEPGPESFVFVTRNS